MNFDPLLQASLVIQIHAISAMVALFLAIIQLVAPKGTLPHRTVGLIWMGVMSITTISSALIQHPVGPSDPFWARFSLIHGFTVLTTLGLLSGTWYLLRGKENIKKHAAHFKGVILGGLVIAGAFAILIPGRIMNQVFFGG